MAYGIQDPTDLARVIAGMSYGGLMDVARQLVAMNAEGERDPKTQHGMAETLFDWAEATVEEAEIEAERAREAEAATKAAA
jgi:hypothetical protein